VPHSIDLFTIIHGAIVIVGWSSDYDGGDSLEILLVDGSVRAQVITVDRPDVAAVYGSTAQNWGFRACAMLPGARSDTDAGVRFSNGNEIPSLAAFKPAENLTGHQLFTDFIARANTLGGSVLEIGSRARSGNTSRDRLNSNIKYIGFDISEGPNVDIVGDAHHLSKFIREPVDFIFSISTFEHFLMPWKVALEMNKVLADGGRVFSQSHQAWPCHDEPWDFFRFSREAWSGLFNAHTGFRVVDAHRGVPMAIVSNFQTGASTSRLEAGVGYGMTVCVAEKISNPKVLWDADMESIREMKYEH
jgi:hypothetical protein